MTNPAPAYYAIIPAHVRYCKELEPSAKLLYGEITALCNSKGYSWASNKYFADLYGVEERTVKYWIHSLQEHGFIFIETSKKDLKWDRKIWIDVTVKSMVDRQETLKNSIEDSNNVYEGKKISPRREKNFPSLNNTYINTTSSSSVPSEEEKNNSSAQPPSAAIAPRLASLFLSKMKEILPSFKEPNMKEWAKHFDYMMRLDNRTEDQVIAMIEWWPTGWWRTKCASPENMRKNFDKMLLSIEGEGENKTKDRMKYNKTYAIKLCRRYPESGKKIIFHDDEVVNRMCNVQNNLKFDMPHEEFVERLRLLLERS